jgi:hypothetical protein
MISAACSILMCLGDAATLGELGQSTDELGKASHFGICHGNIPNNMRIFKVEFGYERHLMIFGYEMIFWKLIYPTI